MKLPRLYPGHCSRWLPQLSLVLLFCVFSVPAKAADQDQLQPSVALLHASPAESTDSTISSDLATALQKLLSALPPGKVLAFTGFSGLDSSKTELSGMANFKLEPMLIKLCNEMRLTLIERDKLELILNEWKLEMSGLTKCDKGARELLGADVILSGKINLEPGQVKLLLKAVSLQDGTILAAAEACQAAEQYIVEKQVTIETNKDKSTNSLLANGSNLHSASSPDGKIKLWTEADSYSVGDKMKVFFEVKEAINVTLVDVTPDGEKTIIFPNQYQKDNFCQPGVIYQIPPADSAFALEVTGPTGKDRLMAMTSAKTEVDQGMIRTRGLKFTNAIVNTTTSRASIALDIF